MARPLPSLLLLLQVIGICFASRKCYYPNGLIAKDDVPCDENAKESTCCVGKLGTRCMANKLCLGRNGNLVRASCTDENWDSPNCPNYCLGADTGGTDLISCSNVTRKDTTYCCDHAVNCCDTGVARFEVQPPNPQVWATWDSGSDAFDIKGTMYTGPASTTVKSSTTAESSTNLKSSTTFSSTQAATTTKPSAIQSSTEAVQVTGTQSPDKPQGLPSGTVAGIAVGSALGAILIAIIFVLSWKVYKQKKTSTIEPPTANPSMYQNTAFQNPYYDPGLAWKKDRDAPQEIHGHQTQGYSVRAELPGHPAAV